MQNYITGWHPFNGQKVCPMNLCKSLSALDAVFPEESGILLVWRSDCRKMQLVSSKPIRKILLCYVEAMKTDILRTDIDFYAVYAPFVSNLAAGIVQHIEKYVHLTYQPLRSSYHDDPALLSTPIPLPDLSRWVDTYPVI